MFGQNLDNVVRTYVRTQKYKNTNVVRMTGAVRGILYIRDAARRVAVPQTN